MQSDGLPEHDALRAATVFGAEAIGPGQDLGSLTAGKLADLVVLDANPLENIRNTNTVRYVMKNGRLYEGHTLAEITRSSGPRRGSTGRKSSWLLRRKTDNCFGGGGGHGGGMGSRLRLRSHFRLRVFSSAEPSCPLAHQIHSSSPPRGAATPPSAGPTRHRPGRATSALPRSDRA